MSNYKKSTLGILLILCMMLSSLPLSVFAQQTEKEIDVPTAVQGLKFNGREQIGVPTGEGYTFTLNSNTQIYVGTHTATAILEQGYKWRNVIESEAYSEKQIQWSIAKGEQTIQSNAPSFLRKHQKHIDMSNWITLTPLNDEEIRKKLIYAVDTSSLPTSD